MTSELKKIIEQSSFEVQKGRFVYTRVGSGPKVKNHFMVTEDEDEITVVTREENLGDLDLIERNKDNYSLIALNVSVPFYSVGFLAAVSGAIAKGGMNILIASTYSKDYIMVKEEKLKKAREALLSLGFSEM